MTMHSTFMVAVVGFLLCAHQIAACSFTKDFGDGSFLDENGLVDFNTAPNAITTCKTTCSSGSVTTQYVRYDGDAGLIFNDDNDFNPTACGTETQFTSGDEQYVLGWRVIVLSPYTGMKLTCTCTAPGDGRGNDGCFSESAKVEVQNKGLVAMKDLQVGDKVLTSNGYQPVYAFGHKEVATEQEFLQIYTASEEGALELTHDHLVFVIDSQSGSQVTIRAEAVKVGDILATADSARGALVTKVVTTVARGAYLPLTPAGSIVVNGVKASTYVSFVNEGPTFLALRPYFGSFWSEQLIFHWWLSPLRMLCMGISSKYCSAPETTHEDQPILNWLLFGREVIKFGEQRNVWVQVFALGIPVMVLFGFLNLVEFLFGAAIAPSMIAMMGISMMWFVRGKSNHVDSNKKSA